VHGKIESHWKIEGSTFALSVTVPANTTATVYLPTSDAASVREGNKPVPEVAGIKLVRTEKGFAVYEIGSGTYKFSCAK
jgi:alpha-L-rhamnosidase